MQPSLRLLLVVVCLCCFSPSLSSAAAVPTITRVVRGFKVPYQASMPEQMVVDRYDHVYALDFENNHVAMFDYNGTFLRSFTTDNPPFKGPTGLAVDHDLAVYIADQANARLVKLHANGSLARVYDGDVYEGVAVDKEGRIYAYGVSGFIVQMAQNGTVLQRYNSTGFGTRGGLAIDCDGHLLVADMQRNRAVRFNAQTGAVMNVWTTTNPALSYPWNIAADCVGHVYIADGFNGRVVQMDDDNRLLAVYMNGTGFGVAVSSKGEVLVAPGGGYNVAVMAAAEMGEEVEAVAA